MSDEHDPGQDPQDVDASGIDELGRRAGAELRQPAPADGFTRLERARRRRAVAAGAAAGAVTVAVIALVIAVVRDDGGKRLSSSTSTTTTADVSTTTSPSSTTTTVPGIVGPPTSSDGTPSSSSSPPDTVPTTGAPTTSTSTTTTEPCPPIGDVLPKGQFDDPLGPTLSGMIGADIRTGRHECFDRVVIELAGEGDPPGWSASYEPDPQVLGASDETVDIAGGATIVVHLGSWMIEPGGGGYDGPTQILDPDAVTIVELRLIENFEGVSRWAIGLDHERPFTVTTLTSPARIVVDIATG